jgi:hypothetical protein
MTWLPWNPSCTKSTTLVVMPTATRHHEGGKYARTIFCSSVGDLSTVSAARGILSSFQLSVKASGNWLPRVRTMFSTALDPVGMLHHNRDTTNGLHRLLHVSAVP